MKQIPLTQGKFAVVDEGDYPYLSRFEWYAAEYEGSFVARRKLRSFTSKGKAGDVYIGMESLIIPPKLYSIIVHKNGDRLDYRKENLSYESYSVKRHRAEKQAGKTSSKYKGVNFRKTGHPKGKPWAAAVYKKDENGVQRGHYCGCFATEEEAALAYNAKALDLFGEMAYQNQIKK